MSHMLDFMIQKPELDLDIGSILCPSDNMENMEIPFENNYGELMSSEFFDSVFSMEKQTEYNPNDDTSTTPADRSPLDFDVMDNGSLDGDAFNISNNDIPIDLNTDDDLSKNLISLLDEEDIQQNINEILGLNKVPQKMVIRQPGNNTKKVIISKQVATGPKKVAPQHTSGNKKVIRVQSINGNGRSLLLPVSMKKFKIISANELKMDNLKVLPARQQMIKKVEQYAASTSSESVDEIDGDLENLGNDRYPALELTGEEKRLLMKEGINLPTHYPLTKSEEKDLKRIRRKIRNKISAQDSRKRKKEYVDQLEEKARRTDEENEILKKRVKILNKENTRLHEQLKKVQELLFSSTSKTTPTTCLMIVLFSTLLVCLPNLRTATNKDLDISEQQLVTSARRALLFNPQSKEDDEMMHLDEFLIFNKEENNEVHFDDEDKENGTSAFIKYLGDLSKKYEALIRSNCTEILQGGSIQEFCKKHEADFKEALQNIRSFMGQENVEDKKFIEPDISDDEGDTPVFKHHNAYLLDDDDPPTKKVRISRENVDYDDGMSILQESVVKMAETKSSLPSKKE